MTKQNGRKSIKETDMNKVEALECDLGESGIQMHKL